MLRWSALAALVALAAAGGVVAADAQYISQHSISGTISSGTFTGIWGDDTTLWVVEDVGNSGIIYTYHLKNMTRDTSKGFGQLHEGGNPNRNSSPDGIWSDGTTMWVADSIREWIFAYRMSDMMRDTTKELSMTLLFGSDTRKPQGLWSNGTIMWVSDDDSNEPHIDAYRISDKSHVGSEDFKNLKGAGNESPWGIWSDGTTMWVSDYDDDKVYAYRMSDKSHDPSRDFKLHSDNGSPTDIWSDGTTIWVGDNTDQNEKIFVYRLPTGPVSTVQPRVFVYIPPPDTTPPHVVSVERTGNATTTDRALTWEVTFSEPVTIRTNIHTNFTQHSPQGAVHIHAALRTNIYTNYTAVANATIPDLGAASDTISVDLLGVVTGGSVSVDLDHPITSDLLIELVAPDCTKFTIHNQTTTFPYKLRQPYDLGDLSGIGAVGQWMLHVSDHAKHWNGTLNGWTLELESEAAVYGSGSTYTITKYVSSPGEYTLSLDGYTIWDGVGHPLADTEPEVNEPYHVVGAVARTCQAE